MEFDEIILVNPFRKMRISIKEPTTLPKTIELKEIVKILKFLYKIKESFNDKDIYSYKIKQIKQIIIQILIHHRVIQKFLKKRMAFLKFLTQHFLKIKSFI